MTRICTICARGGSKGVTNKNIRLLLGKPLLAYSIEQARQTQMFDFIAVSSDSEEILDISKEYGVDFQVRRPNELATDTSAKLPAIRHCVDTIEKQVGFLFNEVVDLDATSPLRFASDIVEVLNLLGTEGAANVITAMPSRRSPYFNVVELNQDGYVTLSKTLSNSIYRRQDAPQCFDMNASIYGWKRDSLMNEGSNSVFHPTTLLYEMPEDRSIDIDSELDWKIVEMIMKSRLEEMK